MKGNLEQQLRPEEALESFFSCSDGNDSSDLVVAGDGEVELVTQTQNNDETCYGQFILLGYNGAEVAKDERRYQHSQGRKHLSKMFFKKRAEPNGIKKGAVMKLNACASQALIGDSSRHTVSYSYGRHGTVLVEYVSDPSKDMFQIGRSSEEQIDFTIVDTWLAAGVFSPAGHNHSARGHQKDESPHTQKPISSTISRYACRILTERETPHRVYIFAAGFDASRNIFLGEKATKWQKKNNEFDGLTTNGVLVLHPNWSTENSDKAEQPATGEESIAQMYVWREVSVDGDIYTLRETRSSMQRGGIVLGETNELQDGTLIDLCGATLLWRSAEGLQQSPSKAELERRLDELNAGKPQCPVNLNTLVIPRRKHTKSNSSSRQPYVYFRCGHVQGKHNWGVNKTGSVVTFRCPICLTDSDRVAQLTMGMESAFHLDSDALDYAFNPCGHVASCRTVRYWSRITLPHGTNSFYPVCPFCTSLLSSEKPFVRLIFQDHCHEP